MSAVADDDKKAKAAPGQATAKKAIRYNGYYAPLKTDTVEDKVVLLMEQDALAEMPTDKDRQLVRSLSEKLGGGEITFAEEAEVERIWDTLGLN